MAQDGIGECAGREREGETGSGGEKEENDPDLGRVETLSGIEAEGA
jgi:hypothetical protein